MSSSATRWLFLLPVALATLQAQVNTGTILGTVTDPSGAGVAGARVLASNQLTGFSRQVTTDQDGSFLLPLLPVSEDYKVTVEANGFNGAVQGGITLQVGQNLRLDFQMHLGSATERVEITGAASLVDTRSSTGGEVMERRRIMELPLNGRNALQLATLLPGVSVATIRTTIDGGNRAGNQMDVSGSRANEVDWQLEGVHFAGSYTNTGMNMPSPDALEEFKLVTNAYSAEFGLFSGAVLRSVLRSGTNQFHGSVWEFLRNNRLNARNFFLPTVSPLKQNQFGVSAGLPVIRNRLFLFSSYQGLRVRSPVQARQLTLLTEAERAGVFRTAVRDPLAGQPFPNNTVPASRFTTPSSRLLNLIPVAPASGVLVVERANPVDTNQWVGKFDYVLSLHDTINVSYLYDLTRLSRPFPAAQFLTFPPNTEDQVVPVLSVSETHIFSPALINEFRFGRSGQEETRTCQPMITPRELGMNFDLTPGGTPVPPGVVVSGRFTVDTGTNCNWVEGGISRQFTEILSWTKGRHQVRAGGEYYFRNSYSRHKWFDSGVTTFNGQITGNAAADYLLGAAATVERRARADRRADAKTGIFFVQDDFKIHRRLTLNLGLRYELLGPYGEVRGPERPDIRMPQMATLRVGEQSTVIPVAPRGLLFPGDKTGDWPDGLNNSMIHLDRRQFQPRVGFAWDVAGDGKTAVRSSFGLYSNAVFGDMIQRDANAPFRIGQVLTLPPGGFADPWRDRVNPFPVELDLTDTNRLRNYFPLPLIGFSVDPFYVMPRVMAITFNVQRQILPDLVAEAGYVSKLGRRLNDTRDVNTAVFLPGTDSQGNPRSTLANVDSRRRLYPNVFSRVNHQDSTANAAYHSLQSAIRYRRRDWTLMSAYTFSKSIDFRSTIGIQGSNHQDSENTRLERGPSDFDRRHILTISWVYNFPAFSGRGLLTPVFGGWELSGLMRAASGSPLTMSSGRDNSLTANGYDRPDIVGTPRLSGDRPRDQKINRYFDPAAFAANQPGRFGNSGRGILYGPGQWQTDLGLIKNFPVRERSRLQFRGELFNAFNRVNLGNPNTSLISPLFSRIADAGLARIVQFGAKFSW
jgi:hypothetical protein